MNFKVSDRVVCVRDHVSKRNVFEHPNGMIVRGQTYVVSGIYHAPNGIGLRIVGLPSFYIPSRTGIDVGWHHLRFRLLEEVQLIASVLKERKKEIDIEQLAHETAL